MKSYNDARSKWNLVWSSYNSAISWRNSLLPVASIQIKSISGVSKSLQDKNYLTFKSLHVNFREIKIN